YSGNPSALCTRSLITTSPLAGTLPKPTKFAENSGGHGSECYDRNRPLLKERKKVDDNGSAEFERRKSCPPLISRPAEMVGLRQASYDKACHQNAMRARRLQCGLSPKSQFRYGCLVFVTRNTFACDHQISYPHVFNPTCHGLRCACSVTLPRANRAPHLTFRNRIF